MPVMPRRLLHLVMAQAQIKDEAIEVLEMNVGDIVRALGLSDQGNRYEEVRAASKSLMGQVLDVDTAEGWVQFHWVDTTKYIKARDAIQFRVSNELLPFVLEVKDMWRVISIRDMTQLQGKHSYRIFELVMADRGFAGKGGNRPGEWFVDVDFDHLRTLLKIGPDEYKLTANLRRKVIEGPVREINEAGLGLRIECDYEKFRRRRVLTGVRLNCKLLGREEPRPVGPATKAEAEEEILAERFPEKYAELLALERASPGLPGMALLSPENRALGKLAEWAKTQKSTKRGKQ